MQVLGTVCCQHIHQSRIQRWVLSVIFVQKAKSTVVISFIHLKFASKVEPKKTEHRKNRPSRHFGMESRNRKSMFRFRNFMSRHEKDKNSKLLSAFCCYFAPSRKLLLSSSESKSNLNQNAVAWWKQ